ncbi:MAG: tetratricopeptide repeat protein [Candidatus Aureabacteria bacterium]|nr:tetratricopeptide repeat protein [Candidatus Auribacterota bacterium]
MKFTFLNMIIVTFFLFVNGSLFPYSHAALIDDLSYAIQIDPRDADSYFSRGYIYFVKEDFDKAIDDFSQAIRLEPTDDLSYYFRGKIMSRKGDMRRAIEDFTKALIYKPNHVAVLFYRSQAYRKVGEKSNAMKDLNQALKISPNQPKLWAWRGYMKKDTGDIGGAVSDYRKAVELDPGYAWAMNQLACILVSSRDPEIYNPEYALSYIERALVQEKSAAYYDTLGCICSELKQWKKAVEAEEQAMALDENVMFEERRNAFLKEKSYTQLIEEKRKIEEEKQFLKTHERRKKEKLWDEIVKRNKNITYRRIYPISGNTKLSRKT